MSRKQLHTIRQRVQVHLNQTAPADVMTRTAFEADELYQNAGKNSTPIAIPGTRHVDGPISAKATAPMPTIGPRSSVSPHVRQASSVFG